MAENNKSITYTVKIELADIEGDVIDKIADAVAKKIALYFPHQTAPMPFWPPSYPQRYWWQTTTTSGSNPKTTGWNDQHDGLAGSGTGENA